MLVALGAEDPVLCSDEAIKQDDSCGVGRLLDQRVVVERENVHPLEIERSSEKLTDKETVRCEPTLPLLGRKIARTRKGACRTAYALIEFAAADVHPQCTVYPESATGLRQG